MLPKIHILFLLLAIAAAKTKDFANYEVGRSIDLANAKIVYDKRVAIGKRNKVLVKMNPPVKDAIIYLNVTNMCELNGYSECIERKSKENCLDKTQQAKFAHVGRGVYKAYYTIRTNRVGTVHLVVYTLRHGLVGQVYSNGKFRGLPIKHLFRPTVQLHWGAKSGRRYAGMKWHAKWLFPETRSYKFKLAADCARIYIDGKFKGKFRSKSKRRPSFFQAKVQKGAHEFVLEFKRRHNSAFAKLCWNYPDKNRYSTVQPEYFRSVDSAIVPRSVKATCFANTYLSRPQKKCRCCPAGTFQPKSGQYACQSFAGRLRTDGNKSAAKKKLLYSHRLGGPRIYTVKRKK